jgi:hypothetical protein
MNWDVEDAARKAFYEQNTDKTSPEFTADSHTAALEG